MLEFKKTNLSWINVISEPGDCTRYDFIVSMYFDDFLIVPFKSTFSFPNRLNKYDILNAIPAFNNKEIDMDTAANILCSSKEININTTVQTARAIYTLYFDKLVNFRVESKLNIAEKNLVDSKIS